MKYDLFISHASEDKDDFVRPLADILLRLKLNIWFDEFTLKLGDSLSKSIDKGLQESEYGLLVISKHFLSKGWPDYEYRSLLQKEINGRKVILPIWHNVDKKEVERYSLFLADKFAVKTSNLTVDQVALKIIEVVKPSVYENISRYLKFLQLVKDGRKGKIHRSALTISEIRHKELNKNIENRVSLIVHLIGKYFNDTEEKMIDSLKRDLYPHRELQLWEIMASVFVEYSKANRVEKESKKKAIARQVLGFSIGEVFESELSEEEVMKLYDIWKKRFHKN